MNFVTKRISIFFFLQNFIFIWNRKLKTVHQRRSREESRSNDGIPDKSLEDTWVPGQQIGRRFRSLLTRPQAESLQNLIKAENRGYLETYLVEIYYSKDEFK